MYEKIKKQTKPAINIHSVTAVKSLLLAIVCTFMFTGCSWLAGGAGLASEAGIRTPSANKTGRSPTSSTGNRSGSPSKTAAASPAITGADATIGTGAAVSGAEASQAGAQAGQETEQAQAEEPVVEPVQEEQIPLVGSSMADTVAQYGTYVPNDPSYRLDVPCFRQVWEPWHLQDYAFTSSPIEMSGCALTSMSMILKYYGLETDPGELNNWLKNNGGYVGSGAIVWSVAVSRVPGLNYLGSVSYPSGADLDFIKQIIDRGFPVLAEMHYKGSSHYVVLCGYNDTTFFVNDPWYENPGHLMNSTVLQGDLPVAYDNADDPAMTIRSIVVFVYEGQTPARTRVITVRSNPPAIPTGWLSDLTLKEIVMTAGSPYMTVGGVQKELGEGTGIVPDIAGGKLRIPLKAFTKELGGTFTYDQMQQKVLAIIQGRHIECWTGIRTAYNNQWFFDWDVPTTYTKGDLLVTAESLARTLGCSFSWDAATGRGTFKPLQ